MGRRHHTHVPVFSEYEADPVKDMNSTIKRLFRSVYSEEAIMTRIHVLGEVGEQVHLIRHRLARDPHWNPDHLLAKLDKLKAQMVLAGIGQICRRVPNRSRKGHGKRRMEEGKA